jgi:hypothetical protein
MTLSLTHERRLLLLLLLQLCVSGTAFDVAE